MKKWILILAVLALFVSCKEESTPSESEPNNTFGTANSIDFGTTYDAEITSGDVDHFSFTAAAGQRYKISAEWVSGDTLNLVLGYGYVNNGYWQNSNNYQNSTKYKGNESFYLNNPYSMDILIAVGAFEYSLTGTGTYTMTITHEGIASGADQNGVTIEPSITSSEKDAFSIIRDITPQKSK